MKPFHHSKPSYSPWITAAPSFYPITELLLQTRADCCLGQRSGHGHTTSADRRTRRDLLRLSYLPCFPPGNGNARRTFSFDLMSAVRNNNVVNSVLLTEGLPKGKKGLKGKKTLLLSITVRGRGGGWFDCVRCSLHQGR